MQKVIGDRIGYDEVVYSRLGSNEVYATEICNDRLC